MQFFEHQDDARRKTVWLLALFVLAVLAMIAALWGVVEGLMLWSGRHASADWLWAISGTVITVVGLGSLLSVWGLRDGGAAVAQRLGGRRLDPAAREADERRLLNVTEEMAIAAGLPVPSVHVLDHEPAINAFAAGYSMDDAVIGISRGALEYLTRDELQGVVAHEVSHIVSGDMRLNLRLMGALHGIEMLGELGVALLRFGTRSRVHSRGRRGDVTPIAVAGLALWLVGSVGYLAGQLIRAAVCRQREYLADAAAVQFTRNPTGLAGALRKVGAGNVGSRLRTARAVEVSHLLFADGIGGWLGRLGATHPPLVERIRRLDPGFSGHFVSNLAPVDVQAPASDGAAFGLVAAGDLPLVLEQAHSVLDGLPEGLRERCHRPEDARVITLALLLGPEPVARRERRALLEQRLSPPALALLDALEPRVATLELRARLPVLDLCLPALRQLPRDACDDLVTLVADLVHLDGRVELFEWSLSLILRRHLYAQVRPNPALRRVGLWGSARVLLSFVARAGSDDPAQVARAFELGGAAAGLRGAELLPGEQCTLADLDRAVEALGRAAPRRRQALVRGVAACIQADGKVGVREGEVFRAVAEALGVAVPLDPAQLSRAAPPARA